MRWITRLVVGGLIVGTGLLGAGCRTVVPERARQVGGGFDMEFTAPSNGLLYLADTHRKTILLSRSVSQGEAFRYFQGSVELAEESLDVNYKGNARDLRLYFEPAPGQPFRWR
jgi:hypothetical protein